MAYLEGEQISLLRTFIKKYFYVFCQNVEVDRFFDDVSISTYDMASFNLITEVSLVMLSLSMCFPFVKRLRY